MEQEWRNGPRWLREHDDNDDEELPVTVVNPFRSHRIRHIAVACKLVEFVLKHAWFYHHAIDVAAK